MDDIIERAKRIVQARANQALGKLENSEWFERDEDGNLTVNVTTFQRVSEKVTQQVKDAAKKTASETAERAKQATDPSRQTPHQTGKGSKTAPPFARDAFARDEMGSSCGQSEDAKENWSEPATRRLLNLFHEQEKLLALQHLTNRQALSAVEAGESERAFRLLQKNVAREEELARLTEQMELAIEQVD